MNNNYINFYNNLVNLTRNKPLYDDFLDKDTFSDRLIILLFHFAFFLNIFKSQESKKILQNLFDYFFRQLELTIREAGYGDVTVNKKMKDYVNIFYSILEKINEWDKIDTLKRVKIFENYLNLKKNSSIFPKYFENYRVYLKNNSFNSLLKSVSKHNF